MAKIGIKGLVYAPYSSGGDGTSIVYTGGQALDDYMIRADLTENRADVSFYADDHKIDVENSLNGVSLTLELSNATDALEKALLGYADGTGGELNGTDAAAPYVGVGFTRKERFKGQITYHGYWIYKVQFSRDTDSSTTKGENIDFQTETLNGNAVGISLSSGGDTIYYSHIRNTVESTVVSWIKGKAGIT